MTEMEVNMCAIMGYTANYFSREQREKAFISLKQPDFTDSWRHAAVSSAEYYGARANRYAAFYRIRLCSGM